jgi:hypothetical protein
VNAAILRAGAALLAAGTFVGANAYVLAHPKNANAPLQPPAVEDISVRSSATPTARSSAQPTASPRATPRGTLAPRITLQPGVRATELPGITYTHVS